MDNKRCGARRARRELFVHEDDWGQIEVLPAECADWCAHEAGRARGVRGGARDHPDGSGWTDMLCSPGGTGDVSPR